MHILSTGWSTAAEVAKRAMVKYQSPKKRKQVADIITVDQVSNTPTSTTHSNYNLTTTVNVELDYFFSLPDMCSGVIKIFK